MGQGVFSLWVPRNCLLRNRPLPDLTSSQIICGLVAFAYLVALLYTIRSSCSLGQFPDDYLSQSSGLHVELLVFDWLFG